MWKEPKNRKGITTCLSHNLSRCRSHQKQSIPPGILTISHLPGLFLKTRLNRKMIAHIDKKRKVLSIDKKRDRIMVDMADRRELASS